MQYILRGSFGKLRTFCHTKIFIDNRKETEYAGFITYLHLLLHIVTLDIEALVVPWHQFTYSLLVPDGHLAIQPVHDSMLHDAFHWETFDHPPYSPDLAPSDFYLFLKMKEHLAGKLFTDDEDLQHAVMDWLNSQAAVWYEEGISELVSRYDKCLNVQGDYVEK